MDRRRGFRRLLAGGLPTLFSIVFAVAAATGHHTAGAGQVSTTVGGSFTLVASDGTTVTDETYRGKWLLVFFGYTFCPDVCPTTLVDIAGALENLGPDAAKLQPIFITVDPERDTPDVMGDYTEAFDPRIVGLTGSAEQIAAVTEAYGAYGEPHKTGAGGDDYVVDHSTYLYVMDPQGKFVRGLAFDTPSESIADTLRKLMAQSAG